MFPSGDDDVEASVAELCGTINAATAALVDRIAVVIAAGSWAGGGYVSVEHWVQVHCGLAPGRAKALCLLARRRDELPETLGRFREGRLSEDQVRPIAQHVPAGYEAAVAGLAEHATANQVARVARSYRFDDEPDKSEPKRDRGRFLDFGWDDNGALRGSFSLPADDGAVVKQALEASRQILFQEREERDDADAPNEEARVTWADALVRIADVALGSDAQNRPGRDRYQVLLHLRAEDLDATQPAEIASLHLGPGIERTIARAMSCDTSVRVLLERNGVAVNEGRKYRTVPDKVRRIVEDRDRGCRVPGCNHTRWLVVHHIIHWRDGGPTETWNLVALCSHHHKLLHQGHLSVTGNPDHTGGLVFRDRHGKAIPNGPPTTRPTRPPPPSHWTHPTGERLDMTAVWLPRSA